MITYGTYGNAVNSGNTITISNLTVPSGSDKGIIILVAIRDSGSTKSVSSVVFNTSESGAIAYDGLSNARKVKQDVSSEVWLIKNPTSTTANVVVTLSGTPSTGAEAVALPIAGLDQTTSTPTIAMFDDSDDTNYGGQITTQNANSDIVEITGVRTTGLGTLTANYTGIYQHVALPSIYTERRTTTTAQQYTVDWTGSGTSYMAIILVELKEASAPSGWGGTIDGVSSINKIVGINNSNISKVNGV